MVPSSVAGRPIPIAPHMSIPAPQPPLAGTFPPTSWTQIHAEADGSPDLAIVNQGLDAMRPREAAAWHLSIMIEMKDVIVGGLPSAEEQQTLVALREQLELLVMANDNGAVLASRTWNGTRQYIYRIRDPEPAHAALGRFIAQADILRAFEYRMQNDPTWHLAEVLLAPGRRFSGRPGLFRRLFGALTGMPTRRRSDVRA